MSAPKTRTRSKRARAGAKAAQPKKKTQPKKKAKRAPSARLPAAAAHAAAAEPPIKVMVSSTVYGSEDLLHQLYAVLSAFGYEVWMSHKGTVRVNPGLSNFENCLKAVEGCDVFLGLITPQYGSGKSASGLSITHKEMLHAIDLQKPSWFVCHQNVFMARRLLGDLGFRDTAERSTLTLHKSAVISDLRVIDMFEAATRDGVPLDQRTGNWVQPYTNPEDVLRFVNQQFGEIEEMRRFLAEQACAKVSTP